MMGIGTALAVWNATHPVAVPEPQLLAPATPETVDKVNQLAGAIKTRLEPCPFVTEHMIHGGIYTRTVRLPANTVCAAVLINPPTTLIVVGSVDIYTNGELSHVDGATVMKGSAGRKIAFTTHSDVFMSMQFRTDAKTVEEAQREFTDEHELLVPLSRTDEHVVLITGE